MSFLGVRSKSERRAAEQENDTLWGLDRFEPSSGYATLLGSLGMPDTIRSTRRKAPAGHMDVGPTQCGNPDCASAWAKPWKSRRRPIFEGRWGCGSKCLESLIRDAVRREIGDGLAAFDEAPHRHRVPLGLLMLAKGWITQPQLRQALEGQKSAGSGKIGEWLQQVSGITSETVTRGLSMQWNCPVLTTEGFEPQRMALVLPRHFVQELEVLPLRIAASRMLYLAFEDRLDASAAFSLHKMTDLKVESGLVGADALARARERLLECEFVPAAREAVGDSEQMIVRIGEVLEERQPIAARLVRIERYYWLRIWLESGTLGSAGTVPVSIEDVADTIFTMGS